MQLDKSQSMACGCMKQTDNFEQKQDSLMMSPADLLAAFVRVVHHFFKIFHMHFPPLSIFLSFGLHFFFLFSYAVVFVSISLSLALLRVRYMWHGMP